MTDWMCQLKLSGLIGIMAALGTHTVMDHVIQISFSWWFDLAVFAVSATAFLLGMRLGFIKCSACQRPGCNQCPADHINR